MLPTFFSVSIFYPLNFCNSKKRIFFFLKIIFTIKKKAKKKKTKKENQKLTKNKVRFMSQTRLGYTVFAADAIAFFVITVTFAFFDAYRCNDH